MAHERIVAGDLDFTVVDNEKWGEHRAGYNGIAQMKSTHYPEGLFVPSFSGVNLEHVLDGLTTGESDDFFEPRRARMHLSRVDDYTVQLRQQPTPRTGVESVTTFTGIAPHYIDVDFQFHIRRGDFPYGYLGLFWASYINGPENNAMYFCGKTPGGIEGWLQFSSPFHGHESTVVGVNDTPSLPLNDGAQRGLFSAFSPARFTRPLFFGLFGPMMFAVMFPSAEGIRLSHSPSGGGSNKKGDGFNPAWDFQYIVNNPEVNREYGWQARIIYKPFRGKRDLLDEYEAFIGEK